MTCPIVAVAEGQLKGKWAKSYLGDAFCSFSGIPYAKPPIGELRFKAPVPVDPWVGVRDATKEGKECPSHHLFFRHYVGSEKDCLNLNVHTRQLPSDNNAPLKPVMVWIHGGGFLYGSNKSELFGPEFLMTEDIVLVSINYRLGALGFLCLDDPSLDIPGNAGMKDMILALKWIQNNIHHFQGDCKNVTIFGESAGGAAVHYLVLSPLSAGLFHKAIAQSGCSLNCWAKGTTNGGDLATHLGINSDSDAKLLEKFRELPVEKIVHAQYKPLDLFAMSVVRPFGPVVERPSSEAFLAEDPVDILRKGTFNKVPMIMGYTSNEGLFFEAVRKVLPGITLTQGFEIDVDHNLKLDKGSEKSLNMANKMKKFYFGDEEPSMANLHKFHVLKSDTLFVHGIFRCLDYQRQHSSPIYFYRFNIDGPFNFYKRISSAKNIHLMFLLYYLSYKFGGSNFFMKIGASMPAHQFSGTCHGDDVGYLFRCFLHPANIAADSDEDKCIRRFVKLWTNFARTGNPTPDPHDALLNVEWRPITESEKHFIAFGKELKSDINPPEKDRMDFWNTFYAD